MVSVSKYARRIPERHVVTTEAQAKKAYADCDKRLRAACKVKDGVACEDVWLEMINVTEPSGFPWYNKNWLFTHYCDVREKAGFPFR